MSAVEIGDAGVEELSDVVERATPAPRDFSELVWLTRVGERGFGCPVEPAGLRDATAVDAATVRPDARTGTITQLERSAEIREDATIVLLAGANYKITAAVGADASSMAVVSTVLDTGSGLDLVHRRVLPDGMQMEPVPEGLPTVLAANKTRLSFAGVVRTAVRVGDMTTQQTQLVSENLPVDMVLGTRWIDSHVEAILPQRRLVALVTGCAVAIDATNPGRQPVRAAELTIVPSLSEVSVRVRCDWRGLAVVESRHNDNRAHLSNGLVEFSGQEVWLRFANFSDRLVTLSPGQIIGYATRPPSMVSLVDGEERSDPVEPDWWTQVDSDHLSSDEQQQLRDILERQSDMWNGRLGTIRGVFHRIDTGDHAPVHLQPRRAGPAAREVERAEVEKMLEADVIERSEAEWSAPVVLVSKADGSTRFCVDYRALNAITKRDVYPLPRLDECVDSLGAAQYFTTLDANSGYWQIPLDEASRDKTSFTCHAGFYRFKRMPFGLVNAPASFQRAMDIILAGVRWNCALVYLDDVVIYSRTFAEHMRHLDQVLGLLRKANVTLKLRKCRFAAREVDYLGHTIKPGRLQMQDAKVAALKGVRRPTTKTELRSFLGLANVYRRFVSGFARIAKPLTDLTKDEVPPLLPSWTAEQVGAFEELKRVLARPPVLALPSYDREFVLDTDASGHQVGCVLQQRGDDGALHPIGFWSRVLNDQESRYSTTEREALAIVWAARTLRHYLEGRRFRVRTDHRALSWIFGASSSDNARLARFRLKLAGMDFVVSHLPGRQNRAADGMSRVGSDAPSAKTDDVTEYDNVPCLIIQELPPRTGPLVEGVEEWNAITIAEMRDAQGVDPDCERLREQLAAPGSTCDEDADGLLVRLSPMTARTQVVVPRALRERVMSLAHYPRSSGHPGGTRLFASLRREFFWPQMAADCKAFVSRCPSCARKELKGKRRHTALLKLFPPSAPLEFVAIDILGPLPKTKSGNRYLLIISDRFSKLTRAVPLAEINAVDVAVAFFNDWMSVYGVPLILLSDNGPQFASRLFQAACATMGVRQVFTSTYHPQTNGQVERFNRTVLEKLTHYVAAEQDDWDTSVRSIVYGYNCQVHASTGFSPFELVLSRPPTVPILEARPVNPKGKTKAAFRVAFLRQLAALAQGTREKLSVQQERYKQVYDAHVRVRNQEIEAGDLVFVRTYADAPGSPKLLAPSSGPYVVRSRTDRMFKVETPSGIVHVNSDRVTKAPRPEDLPANVQYRQEESSSDSEVEDVGDTQEYVIDRLVGHEMRNSQLFLKVRWYGYTAADDTWELWSHLPERSVSRYMRKHRVEWIE
jgi:hypothetical protein